ncbi:MAG: chitooligosaccharide synthase NodC, partial [Mesorhizobium sp.]
MDLLTTASTVAVSSYAVLSTVYRGMQAVYSQPENVTPPSESLFG